MAYVFNRTLNLMGNQPQEEKADIFRTSETGNESQQPASSGLTPGGIKTSVEGAINTSPSSTGAGAQQSLQRSSLVAPKSEVIKANVGKVKMPTMASEALSDIKKAGEGLQSEADKYLASAKTYTSPSESDIQKGISGDYGAFENLSKLLGESVQQTEKFKPQQDIQIEKAGELATPAGIQRTLQREGDEEYTKGMGALDLSLLSQSPEFSQTMEAIGRGQETLKSQADKAQSDYESARLKKEQEGLSAAQSTVKSELEKKKEGITSSGLAAEKNFDNQVAYYQGKYNPTPQEKAQWDKERDDYIKSQSDKIMKETQGIYGGYEYGGQLTPEIFSKVNPQDFIKYNPIDSDYTQFLSPEQINQFNTIMGLLKQEGGITRGLAPGDMFGFDQSSFQKSLLAQAEKEYEQAKALEEFQKSRIPPPEEMTPGVMPSTEPNVGALNIPYYDPNIEVSDKVKSSMPSVSTDTSAFPSIGSLMIPEDYKPKSPVKVSSSSANKYTNRPLRS